jgi:hypothetical protein
MSGSTALVAADRPSVTSKEARIQGGGGLPDGVFLRVEKAEADIRLADGNDILPIAWLLLFEPGDIGSVELGDLGESPNTYRALTLVTSTANARSRLAARAPSMLGVFETLPKMTAVLTEMFGDLRTAVDGSPREFVHVCLWDLIGGPMTEDDRKTLEQYVSWAAENKRASLRKLFPFAAIQGNSKLEVHVNGLVGWPSWDAVIAGHCTARPLRPYASSEVFEVGECIEHATLGKGQVVRVPSKDRIDVRFKGVYPTYTPVTKQLVHARG